VDEPDIQNLIKEIAKTGADPAWVAELISEAQETEAERLAAGSGLADPQARTAVPARPQLRVVVGGLE
jgi:hypothetical protein